MSDLKLGLQGLQLLESLHVPTILGDDQIHL